MSKITEKTPAAQTGAPPSWRDVLPVHPAAELFPLMTPDELRSDRQIAGMVKASPTFVGKVRAEKEATGDVSTVDTRKDSKGRKAHPNRSRIGASAK
jgi:hypothetical protein